MFFVWLSYRSAWVLFAYITIYNLFLLGDVGKSFNIGDVEHNIRGSSDSDYPTRYESMYVVDRKPKW